MKTHWLILILCIAVLGLSTERTQAQRTGLSAADFCLAVSNEGQDPNIPPAEAHPANLSVEQDDSDQEPENPPPAE